MKRTQEEKDEDARVEELCRKIKAARDVITAHAGPYRKGQGVAGEITPCPVCGTAQLRYLRAGYNGHIRAKCQSGNCVEWME